MPRNDVFSSKLNAAYGFIPQHFISLVKRIKDKLINELDNNMTNSNVFEKYNWLKDEFNNMPIYFDEEYDKKAQILNVKLADSRGNIHYSYINDLYEKDI